MDRGGAGWIIFILACLLSMMFLVSALVGNAHAHDMDHPEEDAWYEALKQPDNPEVSCCGVADAYWCDGIHVRDGKTYCTISDDRDIPKRYPRKIGSEIEIPDNKLMDGHKTGGNPTGHSVVFLSSGGVPSVYCFVMDSGI